MPFGQSVATLYSELGELRNHQSPAGVFSKRAMWLSTIFILNLLCSSSFVSGESDHPTISDHPCPKPRYAFVSYTPNWREYPHDTYLHLRCHHRSKSIKCENGKWSTIPDFVFNCEEPPPCDTVPSIENGYFNSSKRPLENGKYPFKSTLTFHCDDGFQLVGPEQIICRDSPLWTHMSPQCIAIHPQAEESTLINPVVILSVTVLLLTSVILLKVFFYALHEYELRQMRKKYRQRFQEYKYQSLSKRGITIQPVYVIATEPQFTDL